MCLHVKFHPGIKLVLGWNHPCLWWNVSHCLQLDIMPTLSFCAKSRKTNDSKSRKWPKTSIWAIFWRFRGQISPNCKFFWKNSFHSNWRSYLILTSGQKQKKLLASFLEKYQSVWFWANLENFSRISPNQEFFSKI